MKLLPLVCAAVAAALANSAGADTVRIVNFNGSSGTLVTATQTLRGTNPAAVSADLNGDGITDSYVQYPFSASLPLSPTTGYAGPRFFGGIRGEALHTAAGQSLIGFGERGVLNGTADVLGVRYQVDAPRVGRFWMLVYFDKVDFANGGSAAPVKFDWRSKLKLSGASRFESLGTVRWVVRDGAQFYVSEQVIAGANAELGFTTNAADGRWAPYDPLASLDFAQASAAWTDRNFQDVTAVGLLVDKDAFSTARSWLQIKDLTVDAYVGAGDGTPNLPPVPAFTTTLTPTSGRAPVSVVFNASGTTDPEGDVLTYAWQFGDGATGTGVSATHTYTTPANYTAILTVTDSFGNVATTSSLIVVRPPNVPPTATLAVSAARGDVPFAVGFSGTNSVDPDGTIVSYSWDFGDGSIGAGSTVNHTYATPGRYTAKLTIADDDGATATASKTIDATINGTLPPVASIQTDLNSGYAPLTVDLSGGGSFDYDGEVVGYRWDFGDGTTAVGPTVTHTWRAEGSYLATLTVTDNNGVSGTTTVPVKVGPPEYQLQTEGHVRLLADLMIRQLTGVFTISGGGVGLRADSGQYHYLYQEMNGDGEFSARVAGFTTDSHPWASAGVMIMAEPRYGQPFLASVVTKEKGVFAYGLPAAGAERSAVAAPGAAPTYVKVSRLDNRLTAFVSADGVTWQPLTTITADLPRTVVVGLVVAGGQNGQVSTATLDHVVPPRTCGSRTGGPVDNPVATLYGADAFPWTNEIRWSCVYNINDFTGPTDDDRYEAAWTAAVEGGGGVIYFPAGTYTFTRDLYVSNGIVIRGEAPSGFDAKLSTFRPVTKFVFPKYEPSFTGAGTPNTTAFKRIRTLVPDSDSNIGIVYVDLNRAGITFKGDATTGTNRNIVVMGVRQNNVAEPDPGIPGSNTFMNGWQRWPYRFTDNVGIQAFENVLVANNRINDASTDDFDQPGYVVEDASQPTGSPARYPALTGSQARFRYTDHYAISVNRSKSTGYTNAGTPDTEPSLFRKGIVIRDNWVFATLRVKVHVSGDGAVVTGNILRDEAGKTRWPDAAGRRLVANNNTLENRGIDWSGYNVTVSANDVEVHRHLLKDGPYMSVDGEGILIQECCGGTYVNGVSITDNTVNSYIGLYKTRDIANAYIARNVVTQGDTDLSDLIYVAADTNNGKYPINNTVVEANTLNGSILFRGNAGSGVGNVIRGNVNPAGSGKITYSTETNVVLENNVGFPTVTPE